MTEAVTVQFERVPIEKVSEYWNRRPCNIKHSPKTVGTREYFDEVAVRKYFVERHLRGFADYEQWRGKKVLEIGCGIGTETTTFAQHGAKVTAVDLSEKSLEIARKRAEVYGLQDRIRFFQANAEELSKTVPVETFDLIYSYGVIHHTPNPERVLRELQKYAGRSTKIKIMVYHRRSWKVFWIVMRFGKGRFWKLPELVAKHSEAQFGCPVTYSYSRRTGRELLEQNGFRVDEQTVDHIFPYRIPDYVQHRYVKVWYFRLIPERWFRALERRLGWHLLMTGHPGPAQGSERGSK